MKRNVKRANTQRTGLKNRAFAYYTGSSLHTGRKNATGLKYGNQKTEVDGITFASKHEATRYVELKYMERAGLIKNLELQQRFELIPAMKLQDGTTQRAVFYVADFSYSEKTKDGWKRVVEDAKSDATKTPVYRMKKKLMMWRYGIDIKEV